MKTLFFIAALLCSGCNLFLDDWGKIYTDAGYDGGVDGVDCGALYPPFNGSVDISHGTTYNQTATYRCDDDFILYGAATRTCGADGSWTGEPPECLTMSVAMSDETWYDGMETCDPASLVVDMPSGGTGGGIDIYINQIPPGSAGVGDCVGNEPTVTLIGEARIDIAFEGGGTCHTACWDFILNLRIPDLPLAEYTVTVGDLSVTANVNP